MKAVTYYRVSTDSQEAEGTSLQTQHEACLDYCQDKGYTVAYNFSEAYSGLTLDRPKLNELRELARNEQIDAVVIYSLDRLSRNATHGVILRDEFEKHHVILESTTEDIEKGPLGEAITYLRGTFSQIEAEKIKERTMRGRKARAKMGQMSGGGFHWLYGYDYTKKQDDKVAIRKVNEIEAKWAIQIYEWLVNEGISTSAITYRLRSLNAPTKRGGLWSRSAILKILKNPAYTGTTYAFTTVNHKPFSKKRDDWIELPGVTPPLISQEMFDSAQKQLAINRKKSTRNIKRQYLLRGRIGCRWCGRAYYSTVTQGRIGNGHKMIRRYHCSGRVKMIVPVDRCKNSNWRADELESLVWQQIQGVLDNPDLIIAEIENQRREGNQLSTLEAELKQVERELKVLNRDQEKLLQWALKGFPENQVVSENKRINSQRETLNAQKAALEAQIAVSQEATLTLPKLEQFVELIRQKLSTLDFETMRLVLDMLNIKVWIDGENVEITGTLPITEDAIVPTYSRTRPRLSCRPEPKCRSRTSSLSAGDIKV